MIEFNFNDGIELQHEKLFGECRVNHPEIQLWTGANGVGKSSLLKYLRDNESKYLMGYRTSYCMQKQLNVLGDFSGSDLIAHLKQYLGESKIKNLEELFLGLDFKSKLSTPIRKLSGGENQALKLIASLSLDSDIYFLDEGTTHLDEGKIKFLFSHLLKLKADGKSIILVEHHPEVLKHCDSKLNFIKKERLEVELGS